MTLNVSFTGVPSTGMDYETVVPALESVHAVGTVNVYCTVTLCVAACVAKALVPSSKALVILNSEFIF